MLHAAFAKFAAARWACERAYEPKYHLKNDNHHVICCVLFLNSLNNLNGGCHFERSVML
jgi:hypothetical protein